MNTSTPTLKKAANTIGATIAAGMGEQVKPSAKIGTD